MTAIPGEIELAKETQDVLRFLIQDHAFDPEFLVTAIQEYYQNNRPSGQNLEMKK